MNCQRCKTESTSWTDDSVRLYGDVSAHLCEKCTNEYGTLLRDLGIWGRVQDTDITDRLHNLKARSGLSVSPEEIKSVSKLKYALEAEAREIALDYIKPLVEEKVQ